MILEVKTVAVDRKSPRARKEKKIIVYRCDQCSSEYEEGMRKERLDMKRHYCSYACLGKSKKVGGIAYEEWIKSCDIPERLRKGRETFQKLHGVSHPFKSDSVKEKIKKTLSERYGSSHPMKSELIRSRVDWKMISDMRHITMKKNESYRKSLKEDKFYDALCSYFGKDDVERCVIINNWEIDFFIKSLDVYVQFDGVYWHGLDRDIDKIVEYKSPRDRVIYNTWLRDREQNEWFEKSCIRLVRITDKYFKDNPSCYLEIVEKFHEQTFRNPERT